MSCEDPVHKNALTTLSLRLDNIGTGPNAADEWSALAYLSGGNAFAEAACTCCLPLKRRLALEEAAALYYEIALEKVERLREKRTKPKR